MSMELQWDDELTQSTWRKTCFSNTLSTSNP